jgi:hypothetical protein
LGLRIFGKTVFLDFFTVHCMESVDLRGELSKIVSFSSEISMVGILASVLTYFKRTISLFF